MLMRKGVPDMQWKSFNEYPDCTNFDSDMFLVLPFVFYFLLQRGFPLCPDCEGRNVACVDDECLPRCLSLTSSGECLQCRDSRFYGKQCENVCPVNCLNSTCQMTNSNVVCTKGCVDGKKGDNCSVNCLPSCKQCDRYDDRCTGSSCTSPLYFGHKCDSPCPDNCKEGCNMTGVCYSCKPGYHGVFCNVACSNCNQCERHTGECVIPCPTAGYYGDRCNVTCDGNCNHGCDRNTGVCDYCAVGYRGERCNVPCPFTCTHCERFGIRCVGPCTNPMYHGDLCNITCPKHCSSGCDRYTGECGSCLSGLTGHYCNVTCSSKCRGECDRETGRCGSCLSGHTGPYCNMTCPSECSDGCDRETGRCIADSTPVSPQGKGGCNKHTDGCDTCVNGKKGRYCNESCPSNCSLCDRYKSICIGPCPTDDVYGRNCSIPCPHACNGCNKETGICITCAAGYSRRFCNEMCSLCKGDDSDCDPKACIKGSEPQLPSKVIYGVVGVLLMAGLILASRKMFYRFRKRQNRSNRQPVSATSADQSDQSQYWATKYWEIKDEDLDSDSFTNKPQPGIHGRYPSSVQQRFDAGLVSQEDNCIGSEPDRDRQQEPETCFLNSQFSDEDSVMENHLYTSAEACGACALNMDVRSDVSTLTCQSEKIKARKTVERRPSQAEQIVKDGSDVSLTSQDLQLTRNGDTLIMWEQNVDLSKVYVKYITANMAGDDP